MGTVSIAALSTRTAPRSSQSLIPEPKVTPARDDLPQAQLLIPPARGILCCSALTPSAATQTGFSLLSPSSSPLEAQSIYPAAQQLPRRFRTSQLHFQAALNMRGASELVHAQLHPLPLPALCFQAPLATSLLLQAALPGTRVGGGEEKMRGFY